MQDLENNNLIILDPLGNIYEIYANLAVMTLLNFNHFWVTQAELCLKGTIVKASCMFATIFLDIYENPRRKNFINQSCHKHHKIINWNKKWHRFLLSHFFVVRQKGFIFLRCQRGYEDKKFIPFPTLFHWDNKG